VEAHAPSTSNPAASLAEKLVVAPDALIRFKGGKIWVHTGSRPAHAVFENASVLLLLNGFALPASVDEVNSRYDLNRIDSEKLIGSLKSIGALLTVSPANDVTSNSSCAVELANVHTASLANAIHHIAGDLMGFGPYIHQRIEAETGVPVLQRLEALLAGVEALKSELQQRRGDFLARQLQQFAPVGPGESLKLHIGAGGIKLDSWINIDAFPAEFVMDVNWGLPFAVGSARYVFLSHTLEHLYYPGEALRLMKDIRRVLSPSGKVRVIVPDIEKCIRAYIDCDEEFYASRRKTWSWWTATETRLEGFLSYAGAGPRPASFFESHKFGYDFETLESLLRRAGFSKVERSEYMASTDPELRVDTASLVAGAMYRDQHYSLFVEAMP
jgi:hypothetical protein